MSKNLTLKKLGFDENDRVVIIHADDFGMSHATLPAVEELFSFGLLSSAAAMVPCPWFPAAAALARNNPSWDIGVHLTINSEWESYRWGPVSAQGLASGMVDERGHFFNDPDVTQKNVALKSLKIELAAQIETAKAGGIDPTHVDTHMFALGHPRLFSSYLEAGINASTLPVAIRPGSEAWNWFDFSNEEIFLAETNRFIELGYPVIDNIYMMNLDTHEDRLEEAKQAFSALRPGVTHFILHPAVDTPELRAMAHDWRCRVADFETFRSEALRDHITKTGVQIIGYRALRDLIQ